MIIRYCKNCGKKMVFQYSGDVRVFCGDQCRFDKLEGRANADTIGPEMPPLDKDAISDDGYVALVAAIVSQASDDVRQLSPETSYRIDAERFFLSDYFAVLTGFEGNSLLRSLQEEYEERQKRKGHRT